MRKAKLFARALASNAVNFVSKDLHAKLRRASGRGEDATEPAEIAAYFRGCFDDYLAQLGVANEDAESFLEGKLLIEHGPGDVPAVAMLMVAHGARHVGCVDRFPLLRLSETNRAAMALLADTLDGARRERFLSCFHGGTTGGELDKTKVAYVIAEPGQSHARGDIEFAYSRSVLEHVNRLDDVLDDLARALKPGAQTLHKVDLRSHGFEWGHPLDFLRVSDVAWTLMSSHNGSMSNRLRVSDYRQALASRPFDDVTITPTVLLPEVEAESIRSELASRFRSRSIEDLTTLGFWLRAKRR